MSLLRWIQSKLGWSICDHCGQWGWGNEVGCTTLWLSYRNHYYDAVEEDPE